MRRIALFHSWSFALISVFVVFGLNVLVDQITHTYAGDIIACVYFGAYGLYCVQNYIGCREYHCLITGPGFLLAALVMLLRVTGVFDHGNGPPYLIFALAALVGHGLEWQYARRTGSHFRTGNTGH